MVSSTTPASCPNPATHGPCGKSSPPRSSALNNLGSALSSLGSGLNNLESDPNNLSPTPDSLNPPSQDSFDEDKATKDSEYYRDTGDCVVLVEGVIFKIHKLLLVKDSPEFEMMLIEAEYPRNDETDEDLPVLRVNDSAEAFRGLCWTLYTSLNDLWQFLEAPLFGSPLPRLKKLSNIATISHKYGMAGTREWAIKGISVIYDRTQNPQNLFQTLTADDNTDILKHLTLAAEMTYKTSMFVTAKSIWVSRIENGDLILQDALAMAEERGWRQFQGRLYLAALRGLTKPPPSVPTTSTLPAALHEVFNLGRSDQYKLIGPSSPLAHSLSLEHRERLFQGHWVLAHIQREFFSTCESRLPLEGPTSSHKLEETVWQDFWKTCVRYTAQLQQIGLIHNDPLAMLVRLQELLRDVRVGRRTVGEVNKLADYVALTPNLAAAEKYVRELKEKFLESLPDYFLVSSA